MHRLIQLNHLTTTAKLAVAPYARILAQHYQGLHLALPVYHVAGTNGKGTVTTQLASALQHGGLRVGLFTSPHLYSLRERIQVDGQPIPPQALQELLTHVFSTNDRAALSMTFFEVLTTVALLYYKASHCQFACLEVGLGGRLDSTNVVGANSLPVITSIGLDHC